RHDDHRHQRFECAKPAQRPQSGEPGYAEIEQYEVERVAFADRLLEFLQRSETADRRSLLHRRNDDGQRVQYERMVVDDREAHCLACPSPEYCPILNRIDCTRATMARIAHATYMHQLQSCGSASALRQRAEISARCAGGRSISGRAVSRTVRLSRSSVMYSTGDLPSIRARKSPGRRLAMRLSISVRGSHVTPARYASEK